MNDDKNGFTLVEVMVVMTVITVLATLVIGAISVARNTAFESTNRNNAKTIQAGLEAQAVRSRKYCGGTGQIACGTYNFADIAGDTTMGSTAAIAGNLGVTLNTVRSTGNCIYGTTDLTTHKASGGGSVTVAANTYTVTPYDAACQNPQGVSLIR